MAGPSSTVDQNLLPVQAYFDVYGNFQTFIGQGQPFYASINPKQSGLQITNSTIDSTTIGATTPSTGVFTNIATTTGQITNAPVNPADITNKLYVDTVAQGLAPKAACKVGTLTSITLSGLQTIDGYTTLAGDRVLVKNQGTSSQNGIYIASASAWTRAVDMDVWAEVPGAYTVLLNGSQANTGWVSTSADTGTINVTPITFVQFSGTGAYYAGTGLTLAANTFSITPVGTAGTYGSASAVPVFITNASGQVTSVTNTSISIANTQVSGLGTMSTQNANNVAITGGSITGTPVSGSTVGGTTITASTQFTGPGTGLTGTATSLSIGGNAATATTSGSVTNSVTFSNTGGAASGTTYNGSVARTIDYSTLGAPSATGTGASGTWNIGITGNAATVTNGVYTTGSYSNPSWITSILGSIVSGAVATATLATTATNIGGGTAGALPYNTGAGATSFLSLGTTNYVLTAGATAPQYVAQSTLSVGSATNATNATYLAGGVAGAVVWQSATGVTGFTAAGTTGQFLQSNGTGTPTWATPVSYATVTDDTTTVGTRYPLFANQTSGSLSTEYTSSTKLQYNPSTGIFTSTGFSGSGASLTALNATNISSGTIGSSYVSGSYTGITGVGTLTAGTWNATTIDVAHGGTGQTTYTDGQLLIGNSSGNTLTKATLTAGTGISITNGNGSISIASTVTGVTIADDTSSATPYYPLFARVTTGTATTEYTSSTKLNYTPSTGLLASTALSANASALTSSNTSNLAVGGTLSFSDTGIIAHSVATTNGYLQQVIQNKSNGASASAEFIAYNDAGTASANFATFGINSSGYTGTGSINAPGYGYFLSGSTDIVVGTIGNNAIHFVVNSGAADALTISTAGNVTTPNVLTGAEVIASNGIFVNNKTIAASYSIPSGYAASSTGPVTISSGQSVTVPSGSRWVVL
jgi:hypothetical protein